MRYKHKCLYHWGIEDIREFPLSLQKEFCDAKQKKKIDEHDKHNE